MKNKLPALFISLSLLFTACTHQDTEVNIPMSPDTAVPTDTPAQTDVPAPTDTSALQTASPETTDTVQSTSDTLSEVPQPAPVPIPENFAISNYITDFDPMQPAFYTLFEDSDYQIYDEAANNAAVEAYKNSFYYENALEDIKSLFHYEDGVLTPNEENWGMLFLDTYQYLTSPEFEIAPKAAEGFKGKFDGVNEEYLIILYVPLPPACLAWSGTADFFVPVYVNARGEAFILDDVCHQSHSGFECVYYDNSGVIHAVFNFGHNEGGKTSAVYSFANGSPKLELLLYGHIEIMEGFKQDGLFLCYGWYTYAPFFWNEEISEYCAVNGVAPDKELAEIICTNEKILEKVPDAAEQWENGEMWIIGGKYITFQHNGSSFEYKDGDFEEATGEYIYGDITLLIVPTDILYEDEFSHAFNIIL